MLASIKDVFFGYLDKTILENINVTIQEGDRVGLVGPNGEGKTTLLNLVFGDLIPDQGEIIRKTGLRTGYFRQNALLESGLSVFAEMKEVYSRLDELQEEMRALEKEMAALPDHSGRAFAEKAGRYAYLTKAFEAEDGYNADVRIRTVLNGMGFSDKYDQPVSELSGGEKTRLALCKLLLEENELLILDEPTNHLDFSALMWLGKFLEEYKGTLLVVSHDRYFLDKTVSRIWDLEEKKVNVYRGNYSAYKLLKKERLERQLKEYEKQRNIIESMTEYAERNIARASTSNSAKSRLHRLANMEIIEKPVLYRRPPIFRFEFERDSVKEVLEVNGLELSVGGKKLADKTDFKVIRGDRLAIVGKNGTGKSTLIKTLAGITENYGRVLWGKNVRLAYYDQENVNLDATHTVIEELWGKYHKLSQTEIRAMLARMLLFAEDTEKKVASLSGGEKAKLGFALTMAEKGNVLLLDEPTNHLDLPTREALEEGLRDFRGTMIFVSHDVYFLNRLATRILDIDEGKITLYECGFEKYWEIKSQNKSETVKTAAEKTVRKENPNYRSAKERSAEVEKKKRLATVEKDIAGLEKEAQNINDTLATGEYAADYKKINELCGRLEEIKTLLNSLYEEWENLAS